MTSGLNSDHRNHLNQVQYDLNARHFNCLVCLLLFTLVFAHTLIISKIDINLL